MMSQSGLSATSSSEEKAHVCGLLKLDLCENQEQRTDKSDADGKEDGLIPDVSVRQRVLKEVGITSNNFIGPSWRPQTAKGKPNIEDSLSEFYKELETIDSIDDTNVTEADSSREPNEGLKRKCNNENPKDHGPVARKLEKDLHQSPWILENVEQKRTTHPGWHQDEARHPKRQRTHLDYPQDQMASFHSQDHWQHRPPFRSKPSMFPQIPYRNPPPPFPSGFHSQAGCGPRDSPRWGGFQHQEDFSFPPAHSFPHVDTFPHPPLNEFSYQHEDYDENPPHSSYSEERGYDCYSDASYNEDCRWFQNPGWHASENISRPPRNAHDPDPCLTLILMRGAPGSGKSTLARELLSMGPSGLILSTDDYFLQEDGYIYDPSLLGTAHEWNQNKAKEAMHGSRSPIIIDNTNLQAWEMKPYVKMALERGYNILFKEPETSWKLDPFELERRNKHGVPQEKIAQMLDRYSFPISVDIVMRSQEPSHVTVRHRTQPQHQHQRKLPDLN